MTNPSELNTSIFPNWCPGCGNFGIWAAFKNAAVKQGWDNTNSAIVAGIGCHGHIINFVKINSFEGLHGRAIPVASGLKYANKNLNVFVSTGDGDCLGEGGNHFIHACRRNQNITILLHNNNIYGLTTGQTSPMTAKGMKTKSTPMGNHDEPFKPLSLAMISGACFVARGYTGDMVGLTDLMIKANAHQGISVLEILQPCVTFNKECSPQFYQENTYKLGEDYNSKDFTQALAKSLEWGPKHIPLGVIYDADRPTAESEFPQIENEALVDKPVEVRNIDEIIKKYY